MTKSLVILYGDVDFDGRAKRMIEVAKQFGEVSIIDASTRINSETRASHSRVLLRENWGVVRRHIVFWWRVVREAWKIKPNLIFAENYYTTFPGWMASRFFDAKFVYDAYELIVPEKGKSTSHRARFWYVLEKFVVPKADLVISANPERAEIMGRHYSIKNFSTYMRNIPERREIKEEEKINVLESYPALVRKNDDECILIYQGDVSFRRGLMRFVKVIKFLPNNYRIIIVGDGPDLGRLKETIKKHNIENRVSTLGRVENNYLPAITSHADIGIVTYPYEGLNNIYCAPNKLFEYSQAGICIISTDQPPIKKLLEGEEFSVLIQEEESLESVAHKIIKLSSASRNKEVNYKSLDSTWLDEFNRVSLYIKKMMMV
ncbi:glycosyltransferase [Halomonas sp. JS92-SW72]|uniref:glycosyltransferase n=1 Tax=Halomonas sp. JS92-SW72 TaxID=2306583 RepID=UPI000E5B57D2|nr:glycosyltransferase [Halomonas sp. JS92-SW72]AXY43693.1 glycosyltransferase [Halomonas sp. JS92-SW72]